MENGIEGKLFRVKTKDGAHINEKIKKDGSRAAIQFDKENGLQGPVDLIEVDENEYTKEIIVEVERSERSIGEMLLEDIFAPVATEVLSALLERAINAGIDSLFSTVIPTVKTKGSELIDKARSSYNGRKKKGITKRHSSIHELEESSELQSVIGTTNQPPVHHTEEEINQIIHNMEFAALYIAAGIRELSNTVVSNSENSERALEIENKLKELSSQKVQSTIDFMLKDSNRDKLDQATVQLFETFRNQCLLVDGKVIPISSISMIADS